MAIDIKNFVLLIIIKLYFYYLKIFNLMKNENKDLFHLHPIDCKHFPYKHYSIYKPSRSIRNLSNPYPFGLFRGGQENRIWEGTTTWLVTRLQLGI